MLLWQFKDSLITTGKLFLPLAHCVTRGCILSGLEYIPNKNNKTIWVLRYSGPDKESLREYAADIASIWAASGKLQFSKCRMLRAALPCFWKQADRRTGKKIYTCYHNNVSTTKI